MNAIEWSKVWYESKRNKEKEILWPLHGKCTTTANRQSIKWSNKTIRVYSLFSVVPFDQRTFLCVKTHAIINLQLNIVLRTHIKSLNWNHNSSVIVLPCLFHSFNHRIIMFIALTISLAHIVCLRMMKKKLCAHLDSTKIIMTCLCSKNQLKLSKMKEIISFCFVINILQ